MHTCILLLTMGKNRFLTGRSKHKLLLEAPKLKKLVTTKNSC